MNYVKQFMWIFFLKEAVMGKFKCQLDWDKGFQRAGETWFWVCLWLCFSSVLQYPFITSLLFISHWFCDKAHTEAKYRVCEATAQRDFLPFCLREHREWRESSVCGLWPLKGTSILKEQTHDLTCSHQPGTVALSAALNTWQVCSNPSVMDLT